MEPADDPERPKVASSPGQKAMDRADAADQRRFYPIYMGMNVAALLGVGLGWALAFDIFCFSDAPAFHGDWRMFVMLGVMTAAVVFSMIRLQRGLRRAARASGPPDPAGEQPARPPK
jgi:hypothetical protein